MGETRAGAGSAPIGTGKVLVSSIIGR
jgi:hypothetical protein